MNKIKKYQTPAGPLPVSSQDIKGGLKLVSDAIKKVAEKTGITNAINSAGKSLNEFLDKPITIQYAYSPFEVVWNGGPHESTQRRGDVVKTVTTAVGIPAIAAGVVQAGLPAMVGGAVLGAGGMHVGSKAGKGIGNLIGTDENGTNLLSSAGGAVGGFFSGVGPARAIANRNIIAYNNVYPFGYRLNSINLKGLTKDVLTGLINPFKKYRPTNNIWKHRTRIDDGQDEILMSRDAAFRKALKIEPLPEQKGLYYDRPDGTVGINYEHPLVKNDFQNYNRDITYQYLIKLKKGEDPQSGLVVLDGYTKGENGGQIGIKDFKYNPNTGDATFTTYDTWDLHPLQNLIQLPKFIRNIEFVKLAGGEPLKWVDRQTDNIFKPLEGNPYIPSEWEYKTLIKRIK